MPDLTRGNIHRLVNNYMGVEGGYLADFSYQSHHDFYIELDLDFNPYELEGTTRERFIHILSNADPSDQAKIIRGVLNRFPFGSNPLRTQEKYNQFIEIANSIEGASVVNIPKLAITSDVVERALSDAETLIRTAGATSGVDRIHTVLHGYLEAVCDSQSITYQASSTLNQLFNLIRDQHPAFNNQGARQQDIVTIFRAFGGILNSLNPIRNQASVAHPNQTLLEDSEAMLVINSARTILHYIDSKIRQVPF
jgi:abortive infection Abi-like protein